MRWLVTPRCGRRCWCWSRCRRWSGGWRWCRLHLERADIDAIIHYAGIAGAALVVIRWRSEVRIAGVNSRTAAQQLIGESRAAVILYRAKHRIGAVLVTGCIEVSAGIIAAQMILESP